MRLNLLFASLLLVSSHSVWANETTNNYVITQVNKSQISLNISVAGTVNALKTVQLAAQMPGRIYAIAGREGDTFSKGDVLIQLEDSALLARLDAAIANRESATASIENAQAQYQRELYSPRSNSSGSAPGGMAMPAMVDQAFSNPMQDMMGMRDSTTERHTDLVGARTRIAQAQTKYRQADANIKEVEASLRDTRSVAPFDGVIQKVYIEEGDTVQPGQPIVNFTQVGQFKVDTDLPVHLIKQLKLGQALSVILDTKTTVEAKVSRIHPAADARRHTVHVELKLPEGTPVTVGQYAEISVPDKGANIPAQLTIPESAVVSQGGMSLVYTVDENGKARLRIVRLGESAGNKQVIVLSGIKENDSIVSNPSSGMKSGTQVVSIEPQATNAVTEK